MDLTEKEKKYDRQIRLWGMTGQRALEKAKICLLGTSAVGAETLKNLILPGVGSFTIVCDRVISEDDLGSNFFVTAADVGQSAAERMTKWLLELNPDVRGTFLNANLSALLQGNPDYFSANGYTLVIATQVSSVASALLSRVLSKQKIPLVLVRSYGLIGYLRLEYESRAIVETFSERQVDDLRITQPFPALLDIVEKIGDPDSMANEADSDLHSHIPYVCLLIRAFDKWKRANKWDGEPLTYKQKKEVGAIVSAAKFKNDEENFAEAMSKLNVINPIEIDRTAKELLYRREADNLTPSSEPFWFCVAGLRQFYEKHKVFPLVGTLADMTSTTDWFVALQKVYRDQAFADFSEIRQTVHSLLGKVGAGPHAVTDDYIAAFCKNVWGLRHITCRPITSELDVATAKSEVLAKDLAQEGLLTWYLLMRAGDRFQAANGRYPGAFDGDDIQADVAGLEVTLKGLLSELSIQKEIHHDFVHEWTRYGAAELHNISSVMGGVAAQETIKLISQQRVPINNTLIFNGIDCTFGTFEL